jgi:hypothetical protein
VLLAFALTIPSIGCELEIRFARQMIELEESQRGSIITLPGAKEPFDWRECWFSEDEGPCRLTRPHAPSVLRAADATRRVTFAVVQTAVASVHSIVVETVLLRHGR